ncbi:hypothetical protein [Bacillus ndiopicus]|uniref:hypothetical protein n=1 Tax=Bacillus ndiopicus TaxID=1347368 RepID=UPI0005A7ED08|nr:hypothetical protein [Bacillus ndiopicus]
MENQTIIQKAFGKIVDERVFEIAWRKAELNKECIECDNKRRITFELLSESLTSDRQKYLLEELEGAFHLLESIRLEYAYRQGLQDSQMIHRELAACGISVTKDSFNITDTF